MGIVFRQSIKSTIVIFTGALLGALTRYFYTLTFSKIQLGFFTNFINLGALLQLIFLMGSGAGLFIYSERFKDDARKKKALVTVSFAIPLVFSLIYSIPLLFFKEQLLRAYGPADQLLMGRFYLWLPLLTGLGALNALLEQYLVSQHKVALSSFTREVVIRVLNLLLLGLFFLTIIGFDLFIILSVLVYLASLTCLLLISATTRHFGFSADFRVISGAEYKGLFSVSWYHLLLGVSLTAMGFLDSILLGVLDKSGLSSLAVYSNAIFIVTIVVIPYRVMTSATLPVLNRSYAENNMEEFRDYFERSALNILLVGVAMCLVISANLANLIRILPRGYEAVLPVTLILMLGRLTDMLTGVNNEVMSVSGRYKINFRFSIVFLVLLVGLNYLLIPRYSYYGAAWACTLALVLYNLAKMAYLKSTMNLLPFSSKTLLVLFAGLAVGLPAYFIPHLANPYLDTVLRTAGIAIAYGAVMLWLKPSPDLTTYLDTVRKQKRLF